MRGECVSQTRRCADDLNKESRIVALCGDTLSVVIHHL
jgi:hypothetical protein